MTYENKKTRYLDPAEIERGIDEVAELAAAQGVQVVLIGGAALQLYGSDRLTKDIDFAATDFVKQIEVLGQLDFGGQKAVTESGVPVDLVVRDDKYEALYDAAIYNAETIEGVPLRVVSPEYLIPMKMVAGRSKDEVDLEFLILDSGADLVRAGKIVEEHLGPYAADEFEQLCAEAAWRRQRGRA